MPPEKRSPERYRGIILNAGKTESEQEAVEDAVSRILGLPPRRSGISRLLTNSHDRVEREIAARNLRLFTSREKFRFIKKMFFESVAGDEIGIAYEYLNEVVDFAGTMVGGQRLLGRFLSQAVPLLLERDIRRQAS